MADKRISQLVERTDIANNDVLPIVSSGATTTNKVTISTIQDWMQDNLDVGVTSVGITIGTTGSDINVSGSPVTSSGNITINIPTATATVRGVLSASDWSTFNNKVPYTGAIQNVNLGEYGLSTGFVSFDTTPTGTPSTQGSMYWDADNETVDVILNGTTMHIGEDIFYPVKNQTGSTIPKGTAVRFAGTVGSSGRLLIAPFLANGSVASDRFMGVTSEEILNGADGKVMHFGRIRQINTNSFNEGDILYASTSVAGGFQTTVPVAPNNIVQIAAVITKSATVGEIFVRPQIGSNIKNDEGVKITSVANNDLLQYQISTGLWENKSVASVVGGSYVPYVGAIGNVSLGSNNLSASTILVDGPAPTSGSFLGFKQASSVATGQGGYTSISALGTNEIKFSFAQPTNFKEFSFSTQSITAGVPGGRIYTLPDASGTLALTSQLGDYVTIATTQTITGAKTFETTTSTFVLMNSTNANGGVLSFRRNGTNVGHIGNSAQLGAGVLDAIEVRSGVGSSVILKTDGGQLTLATGGGVTLTGALNGTSASFTGNVTLGSGSTFYMTAGDIQFVSNAGFGILSANGNRLVSIQNGAFGVSGAATFSSSVTATSFIVGNGQFYRATRSSGSLVTDMIGIPSGTDDVRILSTGDINFVNGSLTNLLSIKNGGNVGIGTPTPTNKLHIVTPAGADFQTAINLEKAGGFGNVNLQSYYVDVPNYGLAVKVGNVTGMVVNGAGQVGIGTTSPVAELHVRNASGSNQATLELQQQNSGSNILQWRGSAGTYLGVISDAGNVGIGTTSITNAISGTERILEIANSNVASLYLNSTVGKKYAIYSSASGSLVTYDITSSAARLILDTNGNFGLGYTSPNKFGVLEESTKPIRNYLGNANAQGRAQNYKIVRHIPVTSIGNVLTIPFTSQGNLNSNTIARISGHSARFNNWVPLGFVVEVAVGHLTSLGALQVMSMLGNASAVSISGMNLQISFGSTYQGSVSDGLYLTIEYMTNEVSYSIFVPGIALN
jgi:hypothetical protein